MAQMITVTGTTLPEAYTKSLIALYENNIQQKGYRECSICINVEQPLQEPRISKLMFGGPYDLERYCQEMLDGVLDFEVETGNWVYTYHARFAPYLQNCIDLLKKDHSSRRAIIAIRDNDVDFFTDDPACLQSIAYYIREGKLDCHVLFRSNDAAKAAFMNMFALVKLQEYVAEQVGVPVGTYQHVAFNYHVYERDNDLLEGYIAQINSGRTLYYDYEDDWKDLMEEEKPRVAALVADLKKKAGL